MSITEHEVGARIDRLPIWPYRRVVLLMAGVGFFFAYFEGVNLGVALPGALEAFGSSFAAAATIVSIAMWGAILGTMVGGWVSDRFGRKAAILMATLIYGIGSALTAFAPNVAMFTAMRFIAVMGGAMATISIAAYLSELAPAGKRGRYVAVSIMPAMAGMASVPFIGLAIIPFFDNGWRLVLLVPVLGTIIFLTGYRFLPESPRWLVAHGRGEEAREIVEKSEAYVRSRIPGELAAPEPDVAADRAAATSGGGTWAELLRPPHRRWVLLFAIIWFGIQIPVKSVLGLGVTLLTERGFDITTSITLTIGQSVGVVVGAGVAFMVSDRWARKYSAMAMTIGCGVVVLLMAFFPTNALIVLAFAGIGMFIGLSAPLLYLLTAEHFPTRIRNRGCAIPQTIGDFGGVAGPYVALGAFALGGFSGTFIVLGVIFMLLAVPLALTRNTTGANLEELAERKEVEPRTEPASGAPAPS
ncbi:MFS transporter [Pseudonocardia kongjuensis]|uniref:MFS transporter n=1 Tax=Pseudonocardia kongjuensis TaxID=102227 RepID=A0ABP4IBF6_9PSEU